MAQLNQTPTMIAPPPQTEDITQIRGYVANLAEILAKLAKDLDYIINGNLDVNNIRANSITAVAMDVQELSAITANMGKLTAGEIYGATIATTETTMPRIEFSSTNNLLKAENNQGGLYQAIEIVADDSILGFPTFQFSNVNGVQHKMYAVGDSFSINNEGVTGTFTVTHPNINVGNFSGSNITLRGAVRIGSNLNIGSFIIPLSTATTVAQLTADYNNLVSALRQMGLVG